MKRRLPFYKRIAVLLVIAVLCIAMARFSSNFTGGILLNELLAPVQGGVMNAWQRVGGIYNTIAETQQIRNENDVLRDQVRELTLENTRLREYSLENKRLRELLDFKERYEEDYTLLGARIIASSSAVESAPGPASLNLSRGLKSSGIFFMVRRYSSSDIIVPLQTP